ncbi:Cytochrome C oxidase, cbb3-type, subunit III [Saccharicrinis carchari]|uniref:Cytochrome C oxidase, cbb3-type, subunit III n=1 Tax=Saccharicrinis carchari TaxID=1168039 RepID=A0A521F1Z1_SACCC|nr:cytochrome c [Saccharicrinis carchari]SMO90205.1 Cytochrome C oxidase, cbb3-type, subunit III [Saccharicrinis carchari]
MKKSKNIIIITLATILLPCMVVKAQEAWVVPDAAKEEVSIFTFDEEFARAGEVIYNNACTSCHGDPTQGNFTPMAPPPGDVASEIFQNQPDGALFHKIAIGRGSMPGFGDALSTEEIWSLVAYIRSFNEDYKQPVPDLEGIEIPVLTLKLSFDDNVDKLVVKVFNDEGEGVPGASVSAFVKGLFGNMLLGKVQTNQLGISYFDVDYKLPGDSEGNIEMLVKASKGYGSIKKVQKLNITEPNVAESLIAGRNLWSTAKKTPIWLIAIFTISLISIWGAIAYVVLGLRKIKKLK